jgi:hypothetical protein
MEDAYYGESQEHRGAVNAVNLGSGIPAYFGQGETVIVLEKAELVIH